MATEEQNRNLWTSPILSYPDLAKNFLFQTVFQFNAGTPLASLFGDIDTVSEMLMLRARSISSPVKQTEKINTHYMGAVRNYPGRTNLHGDITIKFDEFQDFNIAKIFYEWQNLIYNHAWPGAQASNSIAAGGAVGDFIALYTAQITITCYDSALKTKLPYSWKLYDCFPTNNGQIDFNAEGSEKISPSITFNYNTWELYSNNTRIG